MICVSENYSWAEMTPGVSHLEWGQTLNMLIVIGISVKQTIWIVLLYIHCTNGHIYHMLIYQ